MRLPPFDVFEPRTVKEALSILHDHEGALKVMGGGTELVGLMKLRLSTPQYVMTTGRLSAIEGIEAKTKEIIIGAGTTLQEICDSPILAKFKGLVQAASMVGAYAIQNRATVGGNLLQSTRCLYYNQSELHRKGLPACYKAGGNVCNAVRGAKRCMSVYQGDMAPALISFGAKVQLKKLGGTRKIPLSDLYTGNGKMPTAVSPDELLTQISIPIPAGKFGSSYYKLRQRKALDYPLASAASFISLRGDGGVDTVRLVLGAAGPGPRIVQEATAIFQENGLGDKGVDEVSGEAFKIAEAVDNTPLPGSYRRKMMKVVATRALREAIHDIEREGQS